MAAEHVQRIGARIRARREEQGLTRDALAREMGGATNGNAIYRWEIGKHQPSPDAMERLADVLEVEISYFFSDGPSRSASAPDDEATLARIEQKLDAVLEHLGVIDPAELLERELEEGARPSSKRAADSG